MLAITSLASVIIVISGTASADCPPLLILLILIVIVKCAITATLSDIHVHAYHTHLKEPES